MAARARFFLLAVLFTAAPATVDAGIPYTLSKSLVGTEFFSNWWFWKAADPTHGFVDYTDMQPAFGAGLIKATAGWAYIGVDTNAPLLDASGVGRRAVRITSNEKYSHGLFIITVAHMPTGCGSWPAFWMYGEDPPAHIWPDYGEYDIIEGINTDSVVKTTLHTKKGCDQAHNVKKSDFTGSWIFENCDIGAGFGCQQVGPEDSFGDSLNRRGGGTFAAEWDPASGRFRTWFWRAGSEPPDVLTRSPTPDSWDVPYSYFQMTDPTCLAKPDIFKERTVCPTSYFKEMRLVLNTALCGDWAGSQKVWGPTCGRQFQGKTCPEVVAAFPEVLKDAFWNITRLDVYQREEYIYAQSELRAPCPYPYLVWWVWPLAAGLTLLVIALITLACQSAPAVAPEQNRLLVSQ